MIPPGEQIIANAGCGKTYSLANRIIGWLVARRRDEGTCQPRDIVAATFTRKAAGEIQERVLRHLARGATEKDRRDEYLDSFRLSPPVTQAELLDVLEEVAGELGRMQIGTLDRLFHRIAQTCPNEVGLPEGWTIADQPTLRRLQRETIDGWLDASDDEQLRRLAVEADEEILKGSLHRSVLEVIWGGKWQAGLMGLWRRSRPSEDSDPWRWIIDVEADTICPHWGLCDAETIKICVAAIADATLPLKKDNTPDGRWVSPRDKLVAAIEAGRWLDVLEHPFTVAAATGGTYYSKQVPMEIAGALEPLIGHGCVGVLDSMRVRAAGWRSLLGSLDHAYQLRQRETGCYDYGDITDLLSRSDALGAAAPTDLAFRLDTMMRDVALDEYQDTSAEQAQVIQPVINDILSGDGAHEGQRHLLVVADPKQSIYAWRGGTPALLEAMAEHAGDQMVHTPLATSYRSVGAITSFTNAVFEDLRGNPAIKEEDDSNLAVPASAMESAGLETSDTRSPMQQVLDRWTFHMHVSADHLAKQPGGVRIWQCASGKKEDVAAEALTVTIVKDRLKAGADIGILCPSNKQVATIVALLRQAGITVSEEGSGGVEEVAAVMRMLDVLRLGDHPGHLAAAFRVSHSDFGRVLCLPKIESLSYQDTKEACSRVSALVRAQVLDRGLSGFIVWLSGEASDHCDARERTTLRLMAQAAATWRSAPGAPLSDFAAYVESSGLAEPAQAPVRVMTMHGAKGLEFDEVVLPFLDGGMVRGRTGSCMGWSSGQTGHMTAVSPSLREKLRVHLPVLAAFTNRAWADDFADRLSLFYVSITRAKTGLHLIVHPRPKKKPSKRKTISPASLLRGAIPDLQQAWQDAANDEVCLLYGSRDEWRTEEDHAVADRPHPGVVRIRPNQSRSRTVTPSSHGTSDTIAATWRLGPGRARRDGVVLHELFRAVRWLDDGPPDTAAIDNAFDAAAIQLGRPVGSDRRSELLDRFTRAIDGDMGKALQRSEHVHWGDLDLEVLPEHPLLVVLEGGILRGRIDRLVLGRDDAGGVVRAAVLDYKTGRIDDAEALWAQYGDQMNRYAAGVSILLDVPLDCIETKLLPVG